MFQPEPLIQLHHELGEGPLWDQSRQCLWWVNIMAGEIHRLTFPEKRHQVYSVGRPVGTIGLTSGSKLMIAWEIGFAWFDPDSGTVEPIRNDQTAQDGIRFNEGKPGPDGGFWAGTMAYDQTKGAGALFHLAPDLTIQTKLKDLTIANGIVWTADHKMMYYIDTPTSEVWAFDFDSRTSQISNQRVAFRVGPELGSPDGMTIDQNNHLWIALWGGSAVRKWNPATGELLDIIQLPTENVTSCTFGGSNFQTLFITTAGGRSDGATDWAGAVFSLDLPVGGHPPFQFNSKS